MVWGAGSRAAASAARVRPGWPRRDPFNQERGLARISPPAAQGTLGPPPCSWRGPSLSPPPRLVSVMARPCSSLSWCGGSGLVSGTLTGEDRFVEKAGRWREGSASLDRC